MLAYSGWKITLYTTLRPAINAVVLLRRARLLFLNFLSLLNTTNENHNFTFFPKCTGSLSRNSAVGRMGCVIKWGVVASILFLYPGEFEEDATSAVAEGLAHAVPNLGL